MFAVILVLLSPVDGADQPAALNRVTGKALVACARLGVPPKVIRAVFGQPELSQHGRLDWRTNPAPYLLYWYSRYGVWVEWEGSPFPRTGVAGPVIVHGGIL